MIDSNRYLDRIQALIPNAKWQHKNETKIETDLRLVLGLILLLVFACMFLPWTQNIQTKGKLSTLRPEQRPQEINAVISASVESWYVKEGDMVSAGDTLLKLREVKAEYLDPELIERTDDQLAAKSLSSLGYANKAMAIKSQLEALKESKKLKLQQLQNKMRQQLLYVQSDSMNWLAAQNQYKIAQKQFARQKELYDAGLKSLTEFEQRQQAFQDANAKVVVAENKYTNSKNEWLVLQIELSSTTQEYDEKIAKAESEWFSTESARQSNEAEIAKMKNQRASYVIRNGFYLVLAPQDGQITKTSKSGIGEVVKEGDELAIITPLHIDRAVEMMVRPMDLPLIQTGQKVRFMFDGWPAIFFSGWPGASYGTFGGVVSAIDNSIGENGYYRVLVKEDPNAEPWPTALRLGTGAQSIALLKTVPVWYEVWRNLNGFPPDFYEPGKQPDDKKSKKKIKIKA